MVEPHKTDARHKFAKVRFMIEMLHTRTNDPTNWKHDEFLSGCEGISSASWDMLLFERVQQNEQNGAA